MKQALHWLLPFNDLITLLLCFSLAALQGLSSAPEEIQKEKAGVGTELAPLTHEVLQYWVEDDFHAIGLSLTKVGVNKLKILGETDLVQQAQLVMVVCSNRAGEMAWHDSAERLLTLKRQLLDGGEPHQNEALSYELRGTECPAAGAEVPENAVAVLMKV